MEARELDFENSSLDGLVAYYLLHYLPKRSWEQVLSEFARVLRPGGKLLIAMKKGEGEGWISDPLGGNIKTFWAACSAEEIKEVLSSAGMPTIETHARYPLPEEIALDRIYLLAERR